MVPERIASLLASGTEILYALGLGERVVAVSHECDFPAEVAGKPRVTSSHVDPDASSAAIDEDVRRRVAAGEPLYGIDQEQLRALRPELIVTQAQCDVCAVRYDDVVSLVRTAPELAGTAVVALNPNRLDDIFADVERVATAAGCEAAGRRVAAALRARVDAVRSRTRDLPNDRRPRVAAIEWIEPLMLAANWMPELIETAGGQQPLAADGRHSTVTDWNDIAAYDPELVLVTPCGLDLKRTVQEAASLPSLPGWHRLTAVRQDRVFLVDGNAYFNRSGPRIVESLEILARLIHPDLFGWHPTTGSDGREIWSRPPQPAVTH